MEDIYGNIWEPIDNKDGSISYILTRKGKLNMEKQNYTKLYELLKSARDEADAEELTRISEGIEILLELITHRCARK